ncbi:MAG: VCBS repeat-containing protein, partial [Planctomycetaceae bacterium]|nr:VCBS repeat-containing protein [Planctomycetaceae bacterium]
NVEISGLTITGGAADFGGGIENGGGTLLLSNSYVHGNEATSSGGGVDTFNNGTTHVIASTIANNTELGQGGGGLNIESGILNIINSTISGNETTGHGGGILAFGSTTLTITNSTITGNRADSDGTGGQFGGGLNLGVPATMHNSIVAGNFRGTGTTSDDVSGPTNFNTASSFNVIGDAGTAGGLTDGVNNNIVGNSGTGTRTTSTIINTTLQNIDGRTMGHQIVTGGVAHDTGSNALSVDQNSTRLLFDQRGGPFVRVMGGTVDRGAIEFNHLTVNTLIDETDNPDTLSLREAIAIANFNPTFDNIFGLPSGTLNLTQGELVISGNLLLSGPGADQLTIDAQGNSRIFQVNSGIDVEIVGLSLTGGNTSGHGGAIINAGNLTLRGVRVTGNATTGSGFGGGIFSSNGQLTIVDSTFDNNTSAVAGGGVHAQSTTILIVNSTLSDNTANGSGAGVNVGDFSAATIVNSTITGNRSEADGGTAFPGALSLFQSVLVSMHNTIVAGNVTGTGSTPSDVHLDGGSFDASSSNNLIGDAATSGGLTDGTNGNIVGVGGTGVRDINTVLNTTLQNNGGPTPTHLLVLGSPALNAGDNTRATENGQVLGTALATDQRGETRIQDTTVDIGAIERFIPSTLVVSTLTDENDGDFSDGDLSLREAIEIANGRAGSEPITFRGDITGTILLGGTQLLISDDVTITGPGADQLTIDAQGNSRVIQVNGGSDVRLSGLTLTGGQANGGAGIDSTVPLALIAVRVTGNNSSGFAGGIRAFGPLTLVDSTIDNNTSAAGGGGIGTADTTLIINSTISGNTANGSGAGVNSGTTNAITIINSTITGNRSEADGGTSFPGALTTISSTPVLLHNTIIAGNVTGTGTTPSDIHLDGGSIDAASANNLIGNAGSAGGLMNGTNGNIVGVNGAGTRIIATVLNTTLTDNGGPTPTHALVANSVAIDAGNTVKAVDANGDTLLSDQRGFRRVFDGNGDGQLRGDIGSVEAPPMAVNGGIVYDQSNGSFRMATVVNPTTVNWFQTGSLGSHQLGFIGDFNGDGLLDGMTLNPNNLRFNFFRNLGNGALANPVSAGSLSSTFTWGNFMSGDFDGDGRDEVIGQILSGPIGVGGMRSQNFDGTSQFYIRLATGYGAMVAGDFNGDGVDDIVGLIDNPGQTRANIIPIISISTPVGRRMTAILGSGQFGQSVATGGLHNLVSADLNGDGRDDIAVINSNGQILTASTVGTPRINAPDARTFITANSSPRLNPASFSDIVQVGNFDNDILADLFTFHDLGHQVSTTSTLTVDRLPVQTLGIEANPVAGNDAVIGDFDGDGLDDTVVLGTNAFLFISNGTTFNEPAEDLGAVIGGPIGQFGAARTGRVL